jgi:UPF0271 protein
VADDPVQADAVASAVASIDAAMPLLGLPGSQLAEAAARHGLRFVAEAFADRGYVASGRLVPRDVAGALVTEPEAVAERALRMVTERRVTAIDGADIPVDVDSICVHGDTPGAAELARMVRAAFTDAGITVQAFTGSSGRGSPTSPRLRPRQPES